MKRGSIIGVLLALAALSGLAKDRLIRVDDESTAHRKGNVSLSFYDREIARLLVPEKAPFGVVRQPSLMCESSLTYDSVAHVLVYMVAKESIWGATRQATIEWKDSGNNSVEETQRNHPIKYEAPGVTVFTLPITGQQAQTLKKIWTNAVQNAVEEDKDMLILDGTKWLFFVGSQRAKTQMHDHAMAKFVDELMRAVRDGDNNKKDLLIKSMNAK